MTTENHTGNGRSLALAALLASLCALLLLACSGFGARFGIWQFRTGFAILKWSAFLGLAAALAATVAVFVAGKGRHFGALSAALLAFVLGATAFGLPYSWKLKAGKVPRIHDISTDLDHPPQFVALAPARTGDVAYPGASVAAQQLRAYPDLKTAVLGVPMARAYQSALDTAREMGWQIVAAVPDEGRIEATDTTFWYGFKDDIVIRVFPAADRSLVDVRSASRVGISDVGTNAHRIRSFLAKLTHHPAPR
ncbi:hypothetical protein GMLC_00110 [Geomonas limicola]|uniref:DUF1499 domain-containing protein n=1 Tax=Geomonas limicola TaxID=2740186 RepID=A0A6V8N1T5_9BACT|nr:DUF1499 domain-containing protein [Geomonas limicola]GFO66432.1 hypothetical protein GMLC_00110 [Geomonas limicola]